MNPVFTLVIPTLNGHRRMVALFNSIQTKHPYRICVIDNADARRSVAQSWNQGIAAAFTDHRSKYAIVSNDDVIYHRDCLDEMVAAADLGKPFVNCQLLKNPNDMATRFTSGGFSLFLITRECVERVGKFDEQFSPAYYEDNDFFYRMKLAGVSEHTSQTAGFYHYMFKSGNGISLGSTTIATDPEMGRKHAEAMEKNKSRYVAKWGGLPGKETRTIPAQAVQ